MGLTAVESQLKDAFTISVIFLRILAMNALSPIFILPAQVSRIESQNNAGGDHHIFIPPYI